jgi:hypothetical protein
MRHSGKTDSAPDLSRLACGVVIAHNSRDPERYSERQGRGHAARQTAQIRREYPQSVGIIVGAPRFSPYRPLNPLLKTNRGMVVFERREVWDPIEA